MLKQIDKRGKLFIKLQCDECLWTKWIKPKAINKFPKCPRCALKETYQLTEEEVKEVKKELKETLKNPEEIEITEENIVAPVDPKAETEVIKKKPKKLK
jgi:hypothetical protein